MLKGWLNKDLSNLLELDLMDMGCDAIQKQQLCIERLANHKFLQKMSHFHGAVASHIPFWCAFEIDYTTKKGYVKDLSQHLVECGSEKHHKLWFCNDILFCSYCAALKGRAIANKIIPKLNPNLYYYFVTWAPKKSINSQLITKQQYLYFWNKIKKYISTLLKKKIIVGCYYVEELHIQNIEQQLVFPHTHAIICSEKSLNLTDIDPKYNTNTHLIKCSFDDIRNRIRYMHKPLDWARQYNSEKITCKFEILNSNLEQIIVKYLYCIKNRHRFGQSGVFRKKIEKLPKSASMIKINMQQKQELPYKISFKPNIQSTRELQGPATFCKNPNLLTPAKTDVANSSPALTAATTSSGSISELRFFKDSVIPTYTVPYSTTPRILRITHPNFEKKEKRYLKNKELKSVADAQLSDMTNYYFNNPERLEALQRSNAVLYGILKRIRKQYPIDRESYADWKKPSTMQLLWKARHPLTIATINTSFSASVERGVSNSLPSENVKKHVPSDESMFYEQLPFVGYLQPLDY